MQPQTQELIHYIDGLEISEGNKKPILLKLEEEELSEELFEEIDGILQQELGKIENELSEVDDELLEKQAEFVRVKEENLQKKQALQQRHRAGLKKIFDEALTEGKKLAGEIDQFQETKQNTQEAEDIEALRRNLLS